MKGLITFSTATLLALVSANSAAELQTLDDSELSQLRGQSGITIDLESRVSVGEIAYKDAGYITIEDLNLSGIGSSALDNMRVTIDVAEGGETLARGFSEYAMYGSMGLLDAADSDVAWAMSEYDQGTGNYGDSFNDGDLVIHLGATTPGLSSAASFEDNLLAANQAIDFKLNVGAIKLADSGYNPGTYAATTSTTMLSNISMEGYLGPADIIIRNNGDAKSSTLPSGVSVGDSVIEVDANFRVTDLDFTWDAADVLILFNLAGVKINDMKIHNTRGADTLGRFGFASVEAKIASASGIQNSVLGDPTVDGVAVYDVDLRMDLDMPSVSFGNSGTSIGNVYFTDFVFTNTSVIVSAH